MFWDEGHFTKKFHKMSVKSSGKKIVSKIGQKCLKINVTCLFWMFEVPPESLIVLHTSFLWIACHRFDVSLQVPIQQFVDLAVIVVVMTDAEQGVDVVPDRSPQQWRVYFSLLAHAGDIKGKITEKYMLLTQRSLVQFRVNQWISLHFVLLTTASKPTKKVHFS